MKNLDILSNAIASEKPPETAPTPASKMSDDDVDRIAKRMIELMANNTESVVDSGATNETETEETTEETETEVTEGDS